MAFTITFANGTTTNIHEPPEGAYVDDDNGTLNVTRFVNGDEVNLVYASDAWLVLQRGSRDALIALRAAQESQQADEEVQ